MSGRGIDWTRVVLSPEERDALVLEGFADCEALVVQMLKAMVGSERERMAKALELEPDSRGELIAAIAATIRTLQGAALAVSLGQHRTDRYDPDELAKVHACAGMPPDMQSKGGKARAASMTAKQRSALGRKAVKARWARKEGPPDGERR